MTHGIKGWRFRIFTRLSTVRENNANSMSIFRLDYFPQRNLLKLARMCFASHKFTALTPAPNISNLKAQHLASDFWFVDGLGKWSSRVPL